MVQSKAIDEFAARLRQYIPGCPLLGVPSPFAVGSLGPVADGEAGGDFDLYQDAVFGRLACQLFELQYQHNPIYQRACRARGIVPSRIDHWSQIPAVPVSAFKELELSCLPEAERISAFHSSGTTGQARSRHFHHAGSLAVYEASSVRWFAAHLLGGFARCRMADPTRLQLISLTPAITEAPHSSLVHMCDAIRRHFPWGRSMFLGQVAADGAWELKLPAVRRSLADACASGTGIVLLGTAFSLVQLLDYFRERRFCLELPAGSRIMETGGYKGRSRVLTKGQLHGLLARHFGVAPDDIVSEYGMCELSSQGYDLAMDSCHPTAGAGRRAYRFPPWSRVQLVSPETGRAVMSGESGLIRVFDLANVYSVMAIQTEDLGLCGSGGFELIGRAVAAEPRGCSLMPA